jgi:plasmid stabilization system protein ParE
MSYRILVTEQAHRDLRKACGWWVQNRSPQQADEWFEGFARAVYLVSEDPERFPLVHENEAFSAELRQFSYGPAKHATHRAVFTIRDDTFLILRVRNLARKWFAIEGV